MSLIGMLLGSTSLLSVVLLIVIFSVFLGIFLSRSSSGPPKSANPFANHNFEPVKPLVTDQSARDKVLKQGFVASKVPDNLDAVVVGSGIGGLSVAALMAKVGKKVLVLEQHDQAGGCCHTFIEKGYEFDVGIHYIGEMSKGSMTRVLTDHITNGQLEWEPIDTIYDMIAIGSNGKRRWYEMKSGTRESFKENLIRQFPKEEKAINKVMNMVKACKGGFSRALVLKFLPRPVCEFLLYTGLIHLISPWFKNNRVSLQDTLDKITDNKDLKCVFSYCFGDYGSPPAESSFAMQASLLNHFMYGGYYPRGGASEIAFHIIPVIESAGGRVLVRAPVTDIIIKDGKAVGVNVKKAGEKYSIYAPMVISDAGVFNTVNLLPKEIAPKLAKIPSQNPGIRSGYGGFSVFVGFEGSSKDLNLPSRQVWSFSGNNLQAQFEKYVNQTRDEAAQSTIPLVFVSFPSAKDSTWEERYPGKSVCTIITVVNWDWFKDHENGRVMHRGEDYDKFKNNLGDKLWEHTKELFPQLKDVKRGPFGVVTKHPETPRIQVTYKESGSPVTNKYYLGSIKGELYGLDHNKERFTERAYYALRPDTDIPNLYLTGQDMLTCGFTGALFGGLLASCFTLNRNTIFDLISLKGQLKKKK